jgi:Leucine-rich repeat (LRR) protein
MFVAFVLCISFASCMRLDFPPCPRAPPSPLPSSYVTEENALWMMFQSTGRVLDWFSNNNSHCCWEGLFCDQDGRIRLMQFQKKLQGALPAEFGNLTALEEVYITNSNLSGSIPPEIGKCNKLTKLLLWGNNLSGSIPKEIGNLVLLQELWLDYNKLTGIPEELSQCVSLTQLELHHNLLASSLPQDIGNLVNSVEINLSDNMLIGQLPLSIGKLKNLNKLNLQNNRLSGPLPVQIGGMTSLGVLSIGGNGFSGALPDSFGSLTLLTEVYLTDNRFEGSIPTTIGNLKQLTYFQIAGNLFSGLCDELGELAALESMYFGYNRFESIPKSLGNLHNLKFLSLAFNSLSGDVPRELGTLTSLLQLYLQNNSLSFLPSSFEAMTSLNVLDISSNNFSGILPLLPASLGTLGASLNNFMGSVKVSSLSLHTIDLSQNQFDGTLDLSICINLETVLVSQNRFKGALNLSDCRNLQFLSFHDNAFDSLLIYGQNLQTLDASFNSLEAFPDLRGSVKLSFVSFQNNPLINVSETGKLLPPFLKNLVLRNCSLQGDLLTLLSSFPNDHVGSSFFPAYVDLRNNNLLIDSLAIASSLSNGSASFSGFIDVRDNPSVGSATFIRAKATVDYAKLHIFCQQTVMPDQYPLLLPPPAFGYVKCFCVPDYWGDPKNCTQCRVKNSATEFLNCSHGGTHAFYDVGFFPVFNSDASLAGLDECLVFWNGSSLWSPCNSDGTKNITYLKTESSSFWCASGYEQRLCSKCALGYFGHNDKCLLCESAQSTWLLIAVSILSGCAVILFAVIPKMHLVYLCGEVLIFIILLLVSGASSWLVSVLALVVLLQIALQIQQQLREQRATAAKIHSGSNVIVSVSGCLKIMIFFLQTTLSVNGKLFSAFDDLLASLSFLSSLNVSAMQCSSTFQWIFDSELAKFLSFMAVPVILFCAIIIVFVFRIVVQRSIVWFKQCAARKKRGLNVLEMEDSNNVNHNVALVDAPEEIENKTEHALPETTFWSSIVSVGLFLLFVCYFEVAAEILSIYRRNQSVDGTWWMEEMPWIRFSLDDANFFSLIIASGIFGLVYLVGVPVLFAVLIWKYHSVPDHASGFLFENYKPKYYWFEMIWMFRRLSLAVVVSIISHESELAPLLIVSLLGGYAILQFLLKPFKHELENVFDLLATLVILFSYAENFWAERFVDMRNDFIPAGFYVVLVLSMLFLIALIVATCWPFVIFVKQWMTKKCSKRSHFEPIIDEENNELEMVASRIRSKLVSASLSELKAVQSILESN